MQSLVIQTEHLDPLCRDWLAERVELVECSSDDPAFVELLSRADGLVIRTYTTIDELLLNRAPKLKVVGRAGVALENVDRKACRDRGVAVVHTPGANTQAVVEYVMQIMLQALRPLPFTREVYTVDAWKSLRTSLVVPRQLSDCTIGIVGLGRIGRGVARVCEALNVRAVYNDLIEIPGEHRFGAESLPLPDLLAQSDILTIHIDDRPSNRRYFDAAKWAQCRGDVIVINASRGFVVDAPSLAGFMRGHQQARAYLDVHDPEPYLADDPLRTMENVFLLPHTAAATATAHRNMSWVVKDVWRVLNGEAPEWPARIPE